MEFLEVDGVMMLKVDYPLAEKDADALRAYADYKFEQGVTSERERIIKLLSDYSNGETLISVDVAIALIKGENNVA